jgi:hypothetical protein
MEAATVTAAWAAVTAEELTRLYWRQACSDEEIGLLFGVSKGAVYHRRRALGVPSRPVGHSLPLRDRGRSLRCSGPFLR